MSATLDRDLLVKWTAPQPDANAKIEPVPGSQRRLGALLMLGSATLSIQAIWWLGRWVLD